MNAMSRATLAPLRKPQTRVQRVNQARRVRVVRASQLVLLQCAIAFALLPLPSIAEAIALPPSQALNQLVDFDHGRSRAERVRPLQLGDQVAAHGNGSVIEFAPVVTPQREPMPKKKAKQERDDGPQGALEQFRHDHPWLYLLALLGFPLLAGLYLGLGEPRNDRALKKRRGGAA